MNVLGVGETVVDHIQRQAAGTASAEQAVGGTVIAALTVLARLGASCHIITSIAPDEPGRLIRQAITDEGITATYYDQGRTKVHTMHVAANGQRRKVRDNTQHRPITDLSVALIRQADIIILDRHEPAAFHEIVKAKRSDAQILIDPSTEVSCHTLAMMRRAELPIVPIETLAQLDGTHIFDALNALHAICNKPVIVTAGALGSILYTGNSVEIIAPEAIVPLDVTGAGDVYRGAYAYGVLQGWTSRRAARFANAVAARQCTQTGNLSAIPSAALLRSLAQQSAGLSGTSAHLRQAQQQFQQLAFAAA